MGSCLLIWLGVAAATDVRPVLAGETIESIAQQLGDRSLAPVLRRLNGLSPRAQPRTGQLLTLPDRPRQVDQSAFVVSRVGQVTTTLPGGSPRPARAYVALPAGVTVCTAANSYAVLQLATSCAAEGVEPTGDQLVLWTETCVEVRALSATPRSGRSTLIEVREGSVVVADPEGPENRRITVVAGAGIATGTGGFRIHLESDAVLRAEALTAGLALLGDGQQRDLAAGQGARVRSDGSTTEAIDLLGSGPLIAPTPGQVLQRGQFRWEPNPDAFGYRVMLSRDPRGLELVHLESVAPPLYAPKRLLLPVRPDRPVWWTVVSLDRFGFLGLPAKRRPFGVPWGEP